MATMKRMLAATVVAGAMVLVGLLGAMPMSASASPGDCIANDGVNTHEGMNQSATKTTVRTNADGAARLQVVDSTEANAFKVCKDSCYYKYVFRPATRSPSAYERCKKSCCAQYNRIC